MFAILRVLCAGEDLVVAEAVRQQAQVRRDAVARGDARAWPMRVTRRPPGVSSGGRAPARRALSGGSGGWFRRVDLAPQIALPLLWAGFGLVPLSEAYSSYTAVVELRAKESVRQAESEVSGFERVL